MSKSSDKKEMLKQRNEAKENLLKLSRDLLKNDKINKLLFNKMWNMASPASAYRLKVLMRLYNHLKY